MQTTSVQILPQEPVLYGRLHFVYVVSDKLLKNLSVCLRTVLTAVLSMLHNAVFLVHGFRLVKYYQGE